jgi:hypothetical protein
MLLLSRRRPAISENGWSGCLWGTLTITECVLCHTCEKSDNKDLWFGVNRLFHNQSFKNAFSSLLAKSTQGVSTALKNMSATNTTAAITTIAAFAKSK